MIGSGPSAWAAFKSLESLHGNCCEIFVLDAGLRESKSSQIPTMAGKTKFGSSHMYAGTFSNIRFLAPSNFSLANGGLSTVWGAGIRLWEKELLRNYCDTDKIYRSAQQLLEEIQYSGTAESLNFPESFKIKDKASPPNATDFNSLLGYETSDVCSFETALAVDVSTSSSCVGCGKCLTGCPYGSIFDSGTAFDRAVARRTTARREVLIERITPTEIGIEICGSTVNGTKFVETFDEIHLSAGAVGTPTLLLNSNLLNKTDLTILDSQVFYFLGFKVFKKSDVPSFALSQVTLSSNDLKRFNFRASLYKSNEEIRSRIKHILKSKIYFSLPVPRLLDRFLFLGIGFLDSENSGSIKLSKVGDEVLVLPIISGSRQIGSALKRIRKYLWPKGFYIVPGVYIKPLPGLGFHSGGGLPIGSDYVDEFGRLRRDPRIRISDVSILKSIPAGAHTFTSMAIVSSIIKGEYENSNHGT